MERPPKLVIKNSKFLSEHDSPLPKQVQVQDQAQVINPNNEDHEPPKE